MLAPRLAASRHAARAAGGKVPVTSITVESFFTGSGRCAASAQFAYKK